MRESNKLNRRKFLSSTGIAAVGFTGLGSASSSRDDTGVVMTGSAEKSIGLSESNAMSRDEAADYVEQMKRKYGPEKVGSIVPDLENDDVSTQGNSPNTTNLTWEKSWNDNFTVESDQTGADLAHTDHALTLYRGSETDGNDRDIYFLWHWSQSDAVDASWYNSKTSFVRNHVDLTDYTHKVTDFDPSTPLDVNGRYHDVGLEVGYGGVTMGISGQVYVKDGSIEPETGNIDTGGAGQASYIFEGCQKGTTGLNGTTDVRSNDYIWNSDVDWNLYVKATTVSGC